jgi:ATP-binding cassette subfamily B protein
MTTDNGRSYAEQMHACGGEVDWGDEAAEGRWDRQVVGRILRIFWPYRAYALGALIFLTLGSVTALIPAVILRTLLNYLTGHFGKPGAEFGPVLLLVAAGVAAAAVGGLVQAGESWCATTISQNIMADLRKQLFSRLLGQSVAFYTGNRSGQVMSRVVNDVGQIDEVITEAIFGMISKLLVLLTTLGLMLALSWQMTLVTIVVLPMAIVPSRRVGRKAYQTTKDTQTQLGRLNAYLHEILSISGILLVKTFGSQRSEGERFGQLTDRLRDLELRQAKIERWFFALMNTLQAAAPAMLWLAGGWLVLQREATVGTVVTFTVILTARLGGAIGSLGSLHVNATGSLALFHRIFAYLDLPAEVTDRPGAAAIEIMQGRVAFEGVTFAYEPGGRAAVTDLSFEAAPGELVALVGPTGAGKTTVTYLLARFHDPQRGRVLIDGRDVRDVRLESLSRHIGIVFQDTFLFHASIRENLLYARPEASDEDLAAVIKAAQLTELIESLPDGYDTVVGERGHRLSGGEKQRMAIARVILKDPKILILDEATSHLDSVSEQLVQAALRPLFTGRTSLVVAHRLSTVLAADRILVLDHGRLAEQGTHDELLARGGLYATLYERQFESQLSAAESAGPPVLGSEPAPVPWDGTDAPQWTAARK